MNERQLDFEEYAGKPGHVDGSDTSAQAAESLMDGSAAALRVRVLGYVSLSGGATCDEVEVALDMRHQTASARLRELELKGLVEKSGKRTTRSGRSANVYIVTEKQP